MSSIHFVNVASLVPNQRHCNLKLRVLSVETIAETIDPETGGIIQSAEAIVGDETACILLNLKNDQVNLLARNARLQLLNAHVNMYRGFMRLEVNEEEEDEEGNHDTNDNSRERASITAIMDDEDVEGPIDQRDQDGGGAAATTMAIPPNHSETNSSFSTAAASSIPTVATVSSETSPVVAMPASLALASPPTNASGPASSSSSATALSAIALSASTLPSTSRDQMEVEMRLGSGGSVSLMEYYRTMEYTYFSTVEPVGR